MVVEYEYDAWGNIIKSVTIGAGTPVGLDKLNPRLYGSYWYDSTIGLYFMKTRMYDSEIGRFLSKDQVSGGGGSALDFNPYIYCDNNPIDNIDSSGKSFWSAVTQFASKVVQVVKKAAIIVYNAYIYVNNKIKSVVEKYVIKPLANYEPTGRFADWATANPYRLAGVSIAIGAACVGGYVGVQAAISYVAGLGTYEAATTASEIGSAGYTASKTLNPALEENGGVLSGFTFHGIDQVINRGISPTTILNTIRYPQAISAGPGSFGSQIKYFGENATVIVNGMGKLITAWLK